MKKWLQNIAVGESERLVAPILWQILATILEAMPYGFSLMVVLEYMGALKEQRALNLPLLVGQCIGIILSTGALYLVNKKAYTVASDVGCGVQREAQHKLVQHMKKLSMGFFATRDSGDLSNLVVHDTSNLNTMIARLLPKMVAGFLFPILGIVFLVFVNAPMAFAMIVTFLLSVPFIFLARYLVGYFGRVQAKAMNDATFRMLEYIGGIREIKAYNLGGKQFKKLTEAFEKLRKASILQEALSGPSISLSSIVLHGVLPVIMLVGSNYLINGRISVEEFLIFLILGMRMGDPLLMAYSFLAEIAFYNLSADRIQKVLETEPLPESMKESKLGHHEVTLEGVEFAYGEQKEPVLHGISFQVPEHTMTALVGPSGCGKSTITKLIARFWDVTKGSIFIGNLPISQMNSEDIFDSIAMVFQDVYLFHDTVRENIAMGKPKASMEEIICAAKLAACHDFIMKMPKGYDTVIGERGSTLSGGEKQRISIARAILKDAPIILLDEATASLDPENEVYVQRALSNLVQNKTIVVIAHRLNSIRQANQIIVLEDGRIMERGRHEELVHNNGIYNHMWKEQTRAKQWKFK
ncbi:ABC transporter ATP-binding protein [Lacrimispora sp. AGF001]|uniref:ABC transporter ATP-binding protein n=1 Tax=Lacrimispora sp. AGF001 TaxID=3401631 RepID=UPI003B430F5A